MQHLVNVNTRGNSEAYHHRNRNINQDLSDAGKQKAETAKISSIFDNFTDVQFESVYKVISYFYSLSIHIDNTIKDFFLKFSRIWPTHQWFACIDVCASSVKLENSFPPIKTPEFPNWLIKCIEQIKARSKSADNSVQSIISTFSPVMFKLLIRPNAEATLDPSFYVYVKNEFLPIIENLDRSIYDQFLDVLEESSVLRGMVAC